MLTAVIHKKIIKLKVLKHNAMCLYSKTWQKLHHLRFALFLQVQKQMLYLIHRLHFFKRSPFSISAKFFFAFSVLNDIVDDKIAGLPLSYLIQSTWKGRKNFPLSPINILDWRMYFDIAKTNIQSHPQMIDDRLTQFYKISQYCNRTLHAVRLLKIRRKCLME